MCVFSPRRNWSLSTLAEKKRTWMRSMITATAKTRQIAIGYMPKPPPFQCCATVSKIGLIRFRPLQEKSSKPAGTAGPPRLPRTGPLARSAIWVPLTESAIGRLLLLSGAAAAATAEAGTGPLRRARFRTPMAREVTFPRTRHVALSGLEQGGEAKAAGSEAILVPIRVAAQVTPPAGVPLPPPVEPGAPGVPEKGALPAAAPVPALEAGTEAPAPQTRQVPWVIGADVGVPTGETDRCRALDGAPAAVRCASSLEGRDAAGALAARAALAGEAVLLEGLDRWYRLGPEGAGYCRSCELALVEYLREAYGDHLEPFDALEEMRSSTLPRRERPFARQKQALRLLESVEAAKRSILRARDEARRQRYRPSVALLDVEVLLSPRCDHWADGGHERAAAAAVAALARAQLQPVVRLDLSGGIRARLLVLAGATALPAADAVAARRYVEAGGDLLMVGKCTPIDEEGRTGDPLFPEVKSGLERVGEGRVFALDEGAQDAALTRALRELSTRARPQVTISGRGRLFSRAYLDPERKLDVHFVNLDLQDAAFVPAQGVQVSIAGQAAGGGRSGYWFAPERSGGRDGERITLNPSGFPVSTILPSVGGYALLAVPR